jgi:hypothetical protein
MADDAPQWLRDAFDAQARQIADLAAQQANAMANLATRIDQVEEERIANTIQVPVFTPAPTPTPTPSTTTAVRPKPCLPNPDKFDGKDLALFPQFEGLLRAKLQVDGPAIGGEYEKVWYGFGRLSSEAAGRIYPWMSYAQQTGTFTIEGLFGQMNTAFSDPQRCQKALAQLNRTKQRSQPLNEFLNEFNRLILEAKGWGWSDVIKKAYLKAALSTKLLTATVGIEEKDSYDDYCSQLRRVNDQLVELADLTSRRAGWGRKEPQATPLSRTNPSDQMEWEPTTGAAAARTGEPRWATPDEIDRRRQEGLCLHCGKDGHKVRDCRTKLVFKDKKKEVRVAAARKEDKQDALVEELPSSLDELGKE